MPENREIKFRAWDPFNEVMSYSKDLCTGQAAGFFRDFAAAVQGENGPLLMQFTGLHDRFGKDVYEGDIMQQNVGSMPLIVEWVECGFFLVGTYQGSLPFYAPSCSIIGNIYENPELLK